MSTPVPSELIWITEAMVVYKHGRSWFQRRIDDGRFKTARLPGDTKVYLYRTEVEARKDEKD